MMMMVNAQEQWIWKFNGHWAACQDLWWLGCKNAALSSKTLKTLHRRCQRIANQWTEWMSGEKRLLEMEWIIIARRPVDCAVQECCLLRSLWPKKIYCDVANKHAGEESQRPSHNLYPRMFFIWSFPQMCFEGKWLQNRLRADKNESRSLLAVNIQTPTWRFLIWKCITCNDYALWDVAFTIHLQLSDKQRPLSHKPPVMILSCFYSIRNNEALSESWKSWH